MSNTTAHNAKVTGPAPSAVVIGAGIAGSEAAYQLAVRGVKVQLVEMRPTIFTAAHSTDRFAELVCSNSLKNTDPDTAAGLLKQELSSLGSLVLRVAEETRVPAGKALAVDRERFSERLTEILMSHPLIEVSRREADALPRTGRVIIATGPLTSPRFESVLESLVGPRLSFYDAAAPIVDAESIDRDVVFAQSRYDAEGADYLNAPMTRDQYEAFLDALVGARRAHVEELNSRNLFQACQPIEEVARTGRDALRFGALKPVGLTDPRTGSRPWAVVQLRSENRSKSAYNLVGFQTNLAFPEQRRVFSMIPGLQHAEFHRYGVMHRNTFVDAPRVLDATLALRRRRRIRLAGQLTGTEGYAEAAMSGLLAALNTWADLAGHPAFVLPATTAFGALIAHATDRSKTRYQPMHVNFGIMPPLPLRVRGKRDRYAAYAARAREDLAMYLRERPQYLSSAKCATPTDGARRG